MESEFSNADAIDALSTNDPSQFRCFIEHYQHSLFGFLGRMGLSQPDAEDVAQEVFFRAWRYRASYKPDKASPSTWLFTIARNTALDFLKKNHLAPHASEDIENIHASTEQQPECQIQQQQQRDELATALRLLTLEDRCAIALFYLEELSNAQAATVMSCSNAAFRTRLSRARDKLKIIVSKSDDPS